MNIIFIGDIVGDSGVSAVEEFLPQAIVRHEADFCVANAENAAARGVGLSKTAARALFRAGVNVITLGNHTFRDKDVFSLLSDDDRVIRPANYPAGTPGSGSVLIETAQGFVAVINLLGRLYMNACDCPFAAADQELARIRDHTNMVIVDVHAEATSEKCALAYHLDGRASFVCGTHTHVQTADERLLPNGTAFLTDAGMTGPADGVIGVTKETAIRRFRSAIPERFSPASGGRQVNAALVDINPASGRARKIGRIFEAFA